MAGQQGFQFDDPDSRTRSGVLDVVHAKVNSVAPFDRSLFEGFASMRALTYTSSIPMIVGLMRDFEYEDFECVFGHNGVLSREAAEVLSFQAVVDGKLNEGFVGLKGVSQKRLDLIYDRVAENKIRFFVVKDAIAHAKIYLLERDEGVPLRRVIVGSANLSEIAFSGRQAETLVVFDDDNSAWEHYTSQYESVRNVASNRLPLRKQPLPVEQMPIDDIPALRDAKDSKNSVTLYIPAESADEAGYSQRTVLKSVERIKPVLNKGLAGLCPNRQGNIKITSDIVKQITRITLSRQADETPQTYLTRQNDTFTLSGNPMSLDVDSDEVQRDVASWLEFFGNYERGFKGDVPRLQKDYFTFMCWFYFAALMCDLRNSALRRNAFSFEQPMFAVLYGSSNCGKTSLVETLMASMFTYPHIVATSDFTASKLRGLQAAYKRFPIVFDDVVRDRFNRHAPEIIKDETIPYDEYPCFALSMNAEARSFAGEIVKRSLMIYTRTSLPGDDIAARRRLQRSVARIRDAMTTSLYREYLRRASSELEHILLAERDDVDVLEISSGVLCDIFRENLPQGRELPQWCAEMSLEEYQKRAFDRPRLRLSQLLHRDKYSSERKLPEGCWNISGGNIILSVAPMQSRSTLSDIPDWIVDDTASVTGQIVLRKELTEDFLGESVSKPLRWGFLPI